MTWDFRIRGYAGHRHPRSVPYGTLLVETTHSGTASAQMEIEAWQSRMQQRGEASWAELIDLRPGGTLTNLHVYEHTIVPWGSAS